MIRFVIILIAIIAAFWCYNNINFSKITNDTASSANNAKIIKTVNDKRTSDYETEQAIIDNN